MAFRAKCKDIDWAVRPEMRYGPQLRFGPYLISGLTAQSISLHMALNAMFYLLNIIYSVIRGLRRTATIFSKNFLELKSILAVVSVSQLSEFTISRSSIYVQLSGRMQYCMKIPWPSGCSVKRLLETCRVAPVPYTRCLHQDQQRTGTQGSNLTKDVQQVSQEHHFPFARARLGEFVQASPRLGNQYLEDTTLQAYLRRYVPTEVLVEIEPDLRRFGDRVSGELYDLHLQCERDQPYLEKYTAWGEKVDRLITGPAWNKMHDVAAEEGLIAISYHRQYGEWSRLYGLVKNYLFAPSSGLYSCPLAMTDGAASIMERLPMTCSHIADKAYPHLTSRSPEEFWTSGQWMTEKQGGSDVANGTETVAMPQADGTYKLYGYKWFSSATDANMTFTLARIVEPDGSVVPGTKGLSLFYLEVKDTAGSLNNIEIIKMKNKLGTRQLPTAELLLDGTVGHMISDSGRGVPTITTMLKLCRIHTSIMAVSGMRRMVNLSRDYSTRRQAFGNILKDYSLHMNTLARMEVETRGATLLCLENMRLLGREDCGVATDQESNLLRLLVPLSKLYSGKQCLEVGTEGLESFGGQGYIEDTGLPGIVRDAQVLSIWEGTTNVLSLDVLRAIAKSNGQVLTAYSSDIHQKLKHVEHPEQSSAAGLAPAALKIKRSTQAILDFIQENATSSHILEKAARELAYSLCRTYTGALMIDHACSQVGTKIDVYAAQRWCEKDLQPVVTHFQNGHYDNTSTALNFEMVFDGYHEPNRL